MILALVLFKGSGGSVFNRQPTYYPPASYGPAVAAPVLPQPWQEENVALLRVSLPADATLTVDGAATTSTSDVRVLYTPPLEPGREFHYILEAHAVRDGKTVTVSKRVVVRAGEEVKVVLEFPGTGLARK